MVSKPSHNLRREHKWLKETRTIEEDKQFVLQLINKQYTNKRVQQHATYQPAKTTGVSAVTEVQPPVLQNSIYSAPANHEKVTNNNPIIANKPAFNDTTRVDFNPNIKIPDSMLLSHTENGAGKQRPPLISRPQNLIVRKPAATLDLRDQIIAIQASLVVQLRAQSNIITKRCTILESTSLSEDAKKSEISQKIDPILKAVQSKLTKLETDLTELLVKYESLKEEATSFPIDGDKNSSEPIVESYSKTTSGSVAISPTQNNIPQNNLAKSQQSDAKNSSTIIQLLDDDEDGMEEDSSSLFQPDIQVTPSSDPEVNMSTQTRAPIARRSLRERIDVNYKIPEMVDPFDYKLGRLDKPSTQVDHDDDTMEAEDDEGSDYMSTRDEDNMGGNDLRDSDIDFVVNDDGSDGITNEDENYSTQIAAREKENFEIIVSSPEEEDGHCVEAIDLLQENEGEEVEYNPQSSQHFGAQKYQPVANDTINPATNTTEMSHSDLELIADDIEQDIEDDDDEFLDSELEKFDEERENKTQKINMLELDNDLKIISERKLDKNETAMAFDSLPLIKKEHGDSETKDDFDDLSLFDDLELENYANKNSTPQANPGGKYPWSGELSNKLHEVFKLPGFRSNQEEAINATLEGKDVFVLMPTGGGKSLCYQLPAVVRSGKTRGTTIVISPLISLMQDQVEHLLARNIKACMFSSRGTAEERRQTFNLFIHGLLDLIYISPEMISASEQCKKAIRKLHEDGNLARVVIDEAHCVSNWGHDFRPDYKELKIFKREFPDIPMMALTATASEQVRMDIIHNLELKNPVFLKQSFNRTNLFYEVKKKSKNTIYEICDEIKRKFRNQTGIIYCHSKNSCEQTATQLQRNRIKCAYYHAGLEPEERFKIQKSWQTDEIQVICATVAFGMGIDKPDVRFVYHFTIPRTLEGYYQETGRAGRDGKYSYCTTYFSFRDIRNMQTMIQKDENLDRENKEKHLAKLQQVLGYCDNMTDCRRKLVLSYFNEDFDAALCHKNCDNCKNRQSSQTEERDMTEISRHIGELMESLNGSRVTLIQCQDIFKGSRSSKVIQGGYDKLSHYGYGRNMSKSDVERIFFHLITIRVLREYSVMNNRGFPLTYVQKGSNFSKLMSNKLTVKMQFVSPPTSRPQTANKSHSHDRAPTSSAAHSPPMNANLNNNSNVPSFISAKQHLRSFTYSGETPQNRQHVKPIALNNDRSVSHSTQQLSDLTDAYNKLKEVSLSLGHRTNPPTVNFLPDSLLRKIARCLPVTEEEFSSFPELRRQDHKKFKYIRPTIMELRKRRMAMELASVDNSSLVLSHCSTLPDVNTSGFAATGSRSKFFGADNEGPNNETAIQNVLQSIVGSNSNNFSSTTSYDKRR
ncbi:ATP-dependent DNA helicase SGS1 KNAG_0F01640 [Huiozyma naganishii CBS 8797]|uniref:DNA 3'-5' helicase n=1 Tax=Huiozyma naganishii (strain ATCC MYA-139 / BCRC 22969 / CBS 8797 / KCTC 17520 / NBRC 10181 / NCYC 3082 / Yp74L-3) TaxID=1071383 RepID=J7RZZ5_HUIN7|nr:hypothetical protein KNAG_0F01640 [Kazachstania naganishii CBS 8797]CCK70832.1 hypothetical protein KNAG_0F01640 [Kazachstania naganishii CBS 8797]